MDGRVEDESQVTEEFEEESQIDGTFPFTDEPYRRAYIRGADLDHPDQLGEAAVIDHDFHAGLLDYESYYGLSNGAFGVPQRLMMRVSHPHMRAMVNLAV